ncbi:hypothetical protein P3G55_12410 [Leptospira sp. 96542]|nr:hypothetical protein [Leptospira sp. 96542]
MDRHRFPFFFFILPSIFLSLFSLLAQENKTPTEVFLEDKLACYSIPTEIDGLEYQKSLKCISKDSICYLIQGFAMSCIPRNGRYSQDLPDLTPKPQSP